MERKEEYRKEIKKLLKVCYVLFGFGIGNNVYVLLTGNFLTGAILFLIGTIFVILFLIPKILYLKNEYKDINLNGK